MELIPGILGALVGLVVGFFLFRRGSSPALPDGLETSESEASGAGSDEEAGSTEPEDGPSPETLLEEKDAELQELRERVEAVEKDLRERDEEIARSRRWVESRFRRMAQDFAVEWEDAKLPDRVQEILARTKPPAKARLERMAALASQLTEWAEELDYGSAEGSQQMGLWYVLLRRFKEGAEAFQDAASRGMGVEAWLALGDCQWELDRKDKAADAYSHCLKNASMPSHASWRYAEVAFAKRQAKEAMAALEPSLDQKDLPAEVAVLASRVAGKLGQHERAVEICEKALEAHPESTDLLSQIIIPLGRSGDRERAEELAAKAAKLAPEAPSISFALGLLHLDHKENAEAEKHFEKALELRSDYPEALYCLGIVNNQRRRFKKALASFKKAVELRPSYAEAWYAMKDSYEGLKKFDEAIAALEKATKLNPDFE